jgi:hypothetical protein
MNSSKRVWSGAMNAGMPCTCAYPRHAMTRCRAVCRSRVASSTGCCDSLSPAYVAGGATCCPAVALSTARLYGGVLRIEVRSHCYSTDRPRNDRARAAPTTWVTLLWTYQSMLSIS